MSSDTDAVLFSDLGLLHQLLQLRCGRRRHVAEDRWTITTGQIHTIQTDHVKVHVQVKRRTEALNQRDGTGVAGSASDTGHLQQVA